MLNANNNPEEMTNPRLSWLFTWRSSTALVLTIACAAVFADVFAYGMVVPALPYLVNELFHMESDQTQIWVTILLAVYGFANVLASPVFGYIADRGNTRRYSFVGALLIMVTSMLLFSGSNSMILLIVARVLQGIAAAGVWVVGLTIVVDTVEPERIGSAMGYISLAMTSGNVLGPMIGGILYDYLGLCSITIVALSILAIILLARTVMIEIQSVRQLMLSRQNIDPQYHGTCSDISPSDCSIEDDEQSTNSSITFDQSLSRHASTWSLLTSNRFLVIVWSICATSAFYSAFDTILPLQTMRAFQWKPAGSGMIFVPLSAPTLLSPWLGGLVDKFGARLIALSGFAAALPFFIALSFVNNDNFSHKILMYVALFGLGSCLICQMVPLMAEVSKVVDRPGESHTDAISVSAVATGYAFFNAAYAAGILLGALLGGLFCEVAGWQATNLVLGIISVAVAVPLFLSEEVGSCSDGEREPLLRDEES